MQCRSLDSGTGFHSIMIYIVEDERRELCTGEYASRVLDPLVLHSIISSQYGGIQYLSFNVHRSWFIPHVSVQDIL